MYLRKMGHGPTEPISGTYEEGYYGKVNGLITVQELIDYTSLQYTKLGRGVSLTSDVTWLKFRTNGKTILVSNKCLALGFNWLDLSDRGFVTGRYIEIDGVSYVLRLITGGSAGYFSDYIGGEWKSTVCKFTPSDEEISFNNVYTICQEPTKDFRAGQRILGWGYNSATYGGKLSAMNSTNTVYGWRPVLEVI